LEKYLVICSIYGIPKCRDYGEVSKVDSQYWNCISNCRLELGSEELKIRDSWGVYNSFMCDIKKVLSNNVTVFGDSIFDREGLVYHEYVLVKLSKVNILKQKKKKLVIYSGFKVISLSRSYKI
jgi:hypothetical protein